jgi:DNA polymerase III epsilon subunit-like protein
LGVPSDFCELPVTVIDLETTGLDPQIDRVLEVAVISPGEASFESLVRPDIDVFPGGVHGLTPAVVRSAPLFGDIADQLLDLVRGRVLIAHNAAFDLSFLSAEFQRVDHTLGQVPFICTVSMAAELGMAHESRSLAYACQRYGTPLVDPHTAAGDARAAAALFSTYSRRVASARRALVEFVEVSEACASPSANASRNSGRSLGAGHGLRSQSSR